MNAYKFIEFAVVESGGRRLLISKGAPESILDVSTKVSNEVEAMPMPQANEEVKRALDCGEGG